MAMVTRDDIGSSTSSGIPDYRALQLITRQIQTLAKISTAV